MCAAVFEPISVSSFGPGGPANYFILGTPFIAKFPATFLGPGAGPATQPAAAAVPWWSCRRSKGGGRGLDARLLVCRGSPTARVAGLVNTALPRGVAPQQPRTPAEGKPSGVQQEICFYSTVAARPSYHHAGPACIAEPCWLPET